MSDLKIINFSLGELLKYLREKKGISQKDFSKIIGYEVKQIRRFERNESIPTRETADMLSRFYNVDINAYISLSKKFKNINSYEAYLNIRTLLEKNDYEKLEEEIGRVKFVPNLLSKELELLIPYCESVILTGIYQKCDESNFICDDLLKKIGYIEYEPYLNKQVLPELVYLVLILKSCNLSILGKLDESLSISESLRIHFRNIVFSNTSNFNAEMYQLKKSFIVITNNTAHMYFEKKDYQKSLTLIDETFLLSTNFNIKIISYYIYELKFEILYMLGDYAEARKYFYTFEITCQTSDKMVYFNSRLEQHKSKYPKIFTN